MGGMMQQHKMSGRRGTGMDRRTFLGTGAAALPLACALKAAMLARAQEQGSPGLIVRVAKPENLEFPFASLNSFLTPPSCSMSAPTSPSYTA